LKNNFSKNPTCKNFIFGFKFVAPLPANTVVHVLGAEATYISPEESVSFFLSSIMHGF
jgi:hypothetical protein